LLLIETETAEPGFLEGPSAASVVLTLMELNAQSLLILLPVLDFSQEHGEPASLIRRFDEEFSLFAQNIRNLFQAIRAGSIAPEDMARYVDALVELTDQGKKRLLAAAASPDGAGLFDRAAAAWGQVSLAKNGAYAPFSSKARLDADGILRRMPPFAAAEGPRAFFPEARGVLLLERPPNPRNFRRLSLESFLEYRRAEEELYRLLGEAERRGYFAFLEPEAYPNYCYEYARSLQDELLENPRAEQKARWLQGRDQFFRSVEVLISGPSETALGINYKQRLDAGELDEEGAKTVLALQERIGGDFQALRREYGRLMDLRRALEAGAASSRCILGAGRAFSGAPGQRPLNASPTDLEAAALVMNSILTRRAIIPLGTQGAFIWSLIPLLLTVPLLGLVRRPAPTLLAGLCLTLASGALCALPALLSPHWFDPLVPSGGVLAASLGAFHAARMMRRRNQGARGPGPGLARLSPANGPGPGATLQAEALLVAVRKRPEPGTASALERAQASRQFHQTAARLFAAQGGVVAGTDEEGILIAFGAPLDGKPGPGSNRQGPGAAALVRALAEGEGRRWYFGIDAGDCAFYYTEIAGYGAFGAPAARSRQLAALACRHNRQILISAPAAAGIDPRGLTRLGGWKGPDGKTEAVYQITGNSAP
jgi:hypothetical protein